MTVATTGLLAGLMAGAAEDAADRRQARPLAAVESEALSAPPAIDALAALRPREHVHVLAEVKRASPSRGDMAEIPDPAALAAAYAANGASAISVLTEQRRFRGSLGDLAAVRAAVRVPVLRKDFVSSEYQVLEARAAGADIVLLIVAALDDRALDRLNALIGELGMTALVETHDADEARRASDLGATMVGVNARDLDTFELDRTRFAALSPLLPPDAIRVAESAVRTAADVAAYRADGADVVLVGEALVTGDPAALLTAMLAAA